MTLSRWISAPVAAAALGLMALGAHSVGQTQARPKTVRFADITLSGFESAEFELGSVAKATGPNTTVDAVDSKRKSRAKMTALSITATIAPKGSNRVDRIDATGKVTFSGSRPMPDGRAGEQVVKASGNKATYHRTKQVLEIEGPVSFFAEEPTSDGKAKEWITGTAKSAYYDEGKRVARLVGDVQATVFTPDTSEQGSTFEGDMVEVDMGKTPYIVRVKNLSGPGRINIKLGEPQAKGDGKP